MLFFDKNTLKNCFTISVSLKIDEKLNKTSSIFRISYIGSVLKTMPPSGHLISATPQPVIPSLVV